MIDKLLEKIEVLSEIATELYGEEFILNKKFWKSPTEIELRECFEKLETLGFKAPTPTEEDEKLFNKAINKMKEDGTI